MNVLLIVSLYFSLGSCIVLRLPLSIEDSEKFIVRRDSKVTFYESKTDECIHKVYYHGAEIYPAQYSIPGIAYNEQIGNSITAIFDEELPNGFSRSLIQLLRDVIRIEPEYHRKFRRIVIIGNILNNVPICVLKVTLNGDRQTKTIEKIYKYDREVVDVIMDNQDHYMSIRFEENVPDSVKVIKNILTRHPTKVKKYDDLDQVDDEPYLVKGNDISLEQTKKEVEQIINNPTNGSGISEQDLKEAGPSETDAKDADASLLSRQFSNKLRKENFNPNSDSQNE
uniref:Theileria-specific conserved protein n=1 Tax=Theileria annulata TaxID=5874 RepID=A0A3B0N1U8_THEAN